MFGTGPSRMTAQRPTACDAVGVARQRVLPNAVIWILLIMPSRKAGLSESKGGALLQK